MLPKQCSVVDVLWSMMMALASDVTFQIVNTIKQGTGHWFLQVTVCLHFRELANVISSKDLKSFHSPKSLSQSIHREHWEGCTLHHLQKDAVCPPVGRSSHCIDSCFLSGAGSTISRHGFFSVLLELPGILCLLHLFGL